MVFMSLRSISAQLMPFPLGFKKLFTALTYFLV